MLRSILSQSRKTLTSFNLKSNYCSKPRGITFHGNFEIEVMTSIIKFNEKNDEIVPSISEINQVTIVGTLTSDAFTLLSGTKELTVRTDNADSKI